MKTKNYIEGPSRVAWVWPTLFGLVIASLCAAAVVAAYSHDRPQPTSGAEEETDDRVAVSHQVCLHPSYLTPAGETWQINAPTYEACAVGCRDGGYEVFEYLDHGDPAQSACHCKKKQDMTLHESSDPSGGGRPVTGFYTTGTSCGTRTKGGAVTVSEADMRLGGEA